MQKNILQLLQEINKMAYGIKKSKPKDRLDIQLDKYETNKEKMAFLAGAKYQNNEWGKSFRKIK